MKKYFQTPKTSRSYEKWNALDRDFRNPEKNAKNYVEWLDTNQETVDTHLTLGNIFRRRGEVDKAIGIHQN